MTVLDGFVENDAESLPLYPLHQKQLSHWLTQQPSLIRDWVQAQQFRCEPHSVLLLPSMQGLAGAILGIGDPMDPYSYACGPRLLPGDHHWKVAVPLSIDALESLQLGWGLGCYHYHRYRSASPPTARLCQRLAAETAALIEATWRIRDWINTPAKVMSPKKLESITNQLAAAHQAEFDSLVGDTLLVENFPMIHAVGRGSHRLPRLIRLHWGSTNHPHVVLAGKGVCFDTGGLDLKSADGMRNMKKDMGGAAHALGLAGVIMSLKLPIRLTVLIPAVDNAIGSHALRPGDVLVSRSGRSVEVDNTDAEGRLILSDTLTHAGEQRPDLIIDFATLTGAARVALGPDLPALFTNDDHLAQAWIRAGQSVRDPVWQLPLWQPYQRYLHSSIADTANAGSRFAGAVTAALFLEQSLPPKQTWAHLDVYGWNDVDRPGRLNGGEAQGLRSAWAMLKNRYAPK